MMKGIRAFGMAMGMYTALPGFARWDDDCKGLLIAMLPAVGLVLGLLWWGIALLAAWVLPRLLGAAAIALALPLLTGFLHLDGYMDASDAILSRRPVEDKQRILKDPHTGAFAVIALGCLLVVQVAAADGLLVGTQLHRWPALICLPVTMRALAGLVTMQIKPMPTSGYGRMYYDNATRSARIICAVWLVLSLAAAFAVDAMAGLACLGAVGCFMGVCLMAVRSLGGMNGDISGYSITFGEMAGLVLMACLL